MTYHQIIKLFKENTTKNQFKEEEKLYLTNPKEYNRIASAKYRLKQKKLKIKRHKAKLRKRKSRNKQKILREKIKG
jgi:hypothetical protein